MFPNWGILEPQFKRLGDHCDSLVLAVTEARHVDLETLSDVSVALSVDHDGQAQIPRTHIGMIRRMKLQSVNRLGSWVSACRDWTWHAHGPWIECRLA